jgi:hypothetical protein
MFRHGLVVAVLALSPAAVFAQDRTEARRANDLKIIGLAYHQYFDANRKAPEKAEDLAPYFENDKRLLALLKDKDVVFFYGFDLLKIVATTGASNTVLAHEKDVPDKGGYVLYFDGSVKKVSADDFKKLTLPRQ